MKLLTTYLQVWVHFKEIHVINLKPDAKTFLLRIIYYFFMTKFRYIPIQMEVQDATLRVHSLVLLHTYLATIT